ncbi:adenylate/guanylate cyclase domain-containing protein [Phaeobacter marinintestinus]|uniref:adenylate/guanylate cyclase domain-containing protein n=1 Tax=Falsiphaeobacter marinintestinus TaxID=1492905 RepID=UPI0011B434E1|nr:adenylate/guanylate cyclase domain-containing protein [Phaeobacter marinintestinus]
MADAAIPLAQADQTTPEVEELNKYTRATLERHKREGLDLAIKARWITMAVVGVLIAFLRQDWDVLYYEGILALIALNGWFQRRAGRVGQSRVELALLFVDLLIMTVGMIAPNPLSSDSLPLAMQMRFENFLYFFIILAAGTMAYSWRTVMAIGTWTAGMWAIGIGLAWWFATPVPGLTEAAEQAFGDYPRLAEIMDPNSFQLDLRFQEIVVFLLVALTLGFSARRFDQLLLSNAGLERERANLSRYFSPNVVEELSNNDEPLKQVRQQNIGVLFIDIVGFTSFAAGRDPYEVIEVLRGFHARMEAEVFRHNGTLDKYLGDGLMATFGTPLAGDRDATNALECARSMIEVIDRWNTDRRRAGEPEICAGIGIHYGSAVLGDIGANQLEFAVIGTAVNVSSRLEALTRTHQCRLVMSDELRSRVQEEGEAAPELLEGFKQMPYQEIRGIEGRRTIWTLG